MLPRILKNTPRAAFAMFVAAAVGAPVHAAPAHKAGPSTAQDKPASGKADAKSGDLKRISNEGAWRGYTYTEGSGKVCYMTGQPRDRKGNVPKRGESYVLVADRTGAQAWGEVSIVQGYTFKDKSEARVTIGKESFPFFTEDGRAWVKDKADAKVVKAMAAGKEMVVVGISEHGAKTTDVYPLAGFTKVMRDIDHACGRAK